MRGEQRRRERCPSAARAGNRYRVCQGRSLAVPRGSTNVRRVSPPGRVARHDAPKPLPPNARVGSKDSPATADLGGSPTAEGPASEARRDSTESHTCLPDCPPGSGASHQRLLRKTVSATRWRKRPSSPVAWLPAAVPPPRTPRPAESAASRSPCSSARTHIPLEPFGRARYRGCCVRRGAPP